MQREILVLDAHGSLALQSGGEQRAPVAPNLNLALLVDTSLSMAGSKLEQVKAGAADLAVNAGREGLATALCVFGDRAAVVTGPTRDRNLLERKLSALRVNLVGGSTNLAAGLELSLKIPRLRAAVVVTDGKPNSAKAALRAADALKSSGAEILVIATGDADTHFLGQLASRADLNIYTEAGRMQQALASGVQRLLGSGR